MIERLHAFMHRPLRDADRPRLFALAVVLLLASAAALALLDRPTPRPAPEPPPAPEPAAARLPEASAPAADAEAPSEEGKPPAAMNVTPEQVAAAKRAGRRFLTGISPTATGAETRGGSPRSAIASALACSASARASHRTCASAARSWCCCTRTASRGATGS